MFVRSSIRGHCYNHVVKLLRLNCRYFSRVSEIKVKPFWSLKSHLKNCNIVLKTNQDILHSGDNIVKLSRALEHCVFEYNHQINQVELICDNLGNEKAELCLEFAAGFDLNVDILTEGNIYASDLELDCLNFKTSNGDIHLKNIQGKEININALKGDLFSKKVLKGNLDISANGKILTEKLIGSSVLINSYGSVKASHGIYCDQFNVNSRNGDVVISSLHGSSNINVEKGNVCIGTVEGCLNTEIRQAGDIDIFVMEHNTIDVKTNDGNINIQTLNNIESCVDFEAAEVNVDAEHLKLFAENEKIYHGYINKNDDDKVIKAKGNKIDIKFSTWMARTIEFKKI